MLHPIHFKRVIGICLFWALTIPSPWAWGSDEPVPEREWFADQPKGLGEQPWAWKFNYIGESMSSVSGGIRRGMLYEGLLKIGLGVNLEKLCGFDNTVFYSNAIYSHGEGLSRHYTGDISTVSNIDAPNSLRLFKLWVQKSFDQDRFSVRLGVIAADEDFFVSDGASLFLNGGFGAFPTLSQGVASAVYPVSAPGVLLVWKPNETFFLRAAAFSGDVGSPLENRYNLRWNFSPSHGATFFVEGGTKVTYGEKKLIGTYKVGGYYDTESFEDLRGEGVHHGNQGLYAIVDQQLTREGSSGEASQRGLAVFGRVVTAPEDRNLVTFDAETGFTYTGLFPGREKDVLGVGILYARLSPDARDNNDQAYPKNHETVLETSYQASIRDYLSLQPDVQVIWNPGGARNVSPAVVVGLRVNISF